MTILDLIIPTPCAGCGATAAKRWCPTCHESVDNLMAVERDYLRTPTFALASYGGPARRLVIAFKERGRRELASVMGRCLAAGLLRLRDRTGPWTGPVCVVPAPSRRGAILRRGGNHMAAAAIETCRAMAARGERARMAPALTLAWGTRDSVGLAAVDRVANLRGALTVNRRAIPPPNGPVVFVDDVVTTGATAAASVAALAAEGVSVTAVLAFTATV